MSTIDQGTSCIPEELFHHQRMSQQSTGPCGAVASHRGWSLCRCLAVTVPVRWEMATKLVFHRWMMTARCQVLVTALVINIRSLCLWHQKHVILSRCFLLCKPPNLHCFYPAVLHFTWCYVDQSFTRCAFDYHTSCCCFCYFCFYHCADILCAKSLVIFFPYPIFFLRK